MKAMNNHISDINNQISAMLAKLTDKTSKTDKQEEKLTYISYKLSTYEYHMDKVIINEMKNSYTNNHISAMLTKLTNTSPKTDRQG